MLKSTVCKILCPVNFIVQAVDKMNKVSLCKVPAFDVDSTFSSKILMHHEVTLGIPISSYGQVPLLQR